MDDQARETNAYGARASKDALKTVVPVPLPHGIVYVSEAFSVELVLQDFALCWDKQGLVVFVSKDWFQRVYGRAQLIDSPSNQSQAKFGPLNSDLCSISVSLDFDGFNHYRTIVVYAQSDQIGALTTLGPTPEPYPGQIGVE